MKPSGVPENFATALRYLDELHTKAKEAAEEARLNLARAIEEFLAVDRREAAGPSREEASVKMAAAQEALSQRLSELFAFEDDYREHWNDIWASADPSVRTALSTLWQKAGTRTTGGA